MLEKLDKYIDKVIMDAYKSEGREYIKEDVNWFYLVVKNQFLFYINTPYQRVTRKIEYRVLCNITKNFGFCLKGFYYLSSQLDVNFVCNRLKVDGRELFLCSSEYFGNMPKGEVIPSKRYEDLCRAYHEVSLAEYRVKYDYLDLPSNISWRDYMELYVRVYGESPEVSIDYMSSNVVV